MNFHQQKEPSFAMKDGYPYSPIYNDVYFSGDGLEESRTVFLAPHGLEGRWQEGASFHVLETGFGTGLNFLTTLELFRKHGRGYLHYFACEAFPLQAQEIRTALSHASSLQPFLEELLAVYDPRLRGFQRFFLQKGVTLTLLLGDARHLLPQLQTIVSGARFDAFYLDGFAPDRNPELWNEAIYLELSRLGKKGSTLSTFTVAGQVRRGLVEAGFHVEKRPGAGRKKEFLFASLVNPGQRTERAPWYRLECPSARAGKEVVIIGAGLAGCLTARSLADRGYSVTLLDREKSVARCTSGNPLGIVMPVLSRKESIFSRLTLGAFLSFLRKFAHLSVFPPGIVQLHYDQQAGERLEEALAWLESMGAGTLARHVSQEEIAGILGTSVNFPGILFTEACVLDPVALCLDQINHPAIDFQPGTEIAQISALPEGMELKSQDRVFISNITIVTTGHRLFDPLGWLPVRPFQGQLTYLPQQRSAPEKPVCYNGYMLPARNGFHVCGATYEEGEGSGFDPQKNQEILESLQSALPGVLPDRPVESYAGRAAVRAASTDYTPVIGPVPLREAFMSDYAIIQKKALHKISHLPLPPVLPGLYTMTGIGSRGLLYSHLGANLLSSQISGDILPLESDLVAALNPLRFLYRELRRKMSA
ncbi:MAG: bifunctional tRNA (5-methylaminomethyl-2-thiouridine)(34)-methyltransferase MnmD/FAD-dependent 5-carboxymethylaminomethyl-2-thiouridine(34) oxidoreductase MnmC [Spirochaetales bacterium]|nr:bifunctional tRNA (5-methylaminomethyl-2-thiouridine)(34)-methyltransferase MnmD/FAD-dependent 5-carboxymethylaminomethyl-2-thiouridine(34) oxidoreductase MnmC [Spirochaetales bacterium]